MKSPLLTIHQAAAFLQIPVRTVYGLVQCTDFPARKIGKRWRIDEEKLHQWFLNGIADK